jgi:predicted nucleic acid-binding protein
VSTYFDSAVLVKVYCLEATSPQALTLVKRAAPPLPFTPLHSLEIGNALRLKRHRREITQAQLRGALAGIREDLAGGFLRRLDHDVAAVYLQADSLSAAYTVATGARSLDILHVAAALIIEAREFVSFDRRQRRLARRAGLDVRPRTIPVA